MKRYSLLLIPMLLFSSVLSSLHAAEKQCVSYLLACMSGIGIAHKYVAEEDQQARTTFTAGLGSLLIAASSMAVIEKLGTFSLGSDFFTASTLGSSLKILVAVAAAAGFSHWLGAYKTIYQKKKYAVDYLQGLLYGGLLALPFCSDI